MQTRLCKVSFQARQKKSLQKNTKKFTEKYKKCHQEMQTRLCKVSFQAQLKKVHRKIQKKFTEKSKKAPRNLI